MLAKHYFVEMLNKRTKRKRAEFLIELRLSLYLVPLLIP